MEKFKVKFFPDNKEILVERGKTILSAAISLGVQINTSCGGDGVCGRCKVILKKGTIHSQPTGRISLEERRLGYYLSCLTTVESDLEIEVPAESRLDLEKISDEEAFISRLKGIFVQSEEIVEAGLENLPQDFFVHSPLATKLFLDIPKPTLEDKISDLERLYREIRKTLNIPIMQTGLSNVRRLAQLLRSSNWQVTVTLGKRNETVEIVLIEPGDTSNKNFGIAFDIGTTTISAQLVDLNTKKVLSTKAIFNKQANFGADVITRIIFAQQQDGLERLHHAVIDGMNGMIQEMIKEHNIDLNDLTCCMSAGNTTMVHLLLKIDPTFIRREPYIPAANFVPVVRGAEAGIKINPRGLLACVPGVSSYVGGDITAGILACGMSDREDLTLLIDIGTNGEIVLGNKDWLISAAASAGPAFEGSGVVSGIRATKGAIQRVGINKKNFELEFETIGNTLPQGICGSGYIDLLSELLKTNIIDKSGRINSDLDINSIRQGELGREFVVVRKEHCANNVDIVITEADIENLKRSKAAIFAATSILVKHMDFNFNEIKKIYIAGGFGTYLDMEKAIYIGLLPDLPREKFSFIGNSSLVGSREILLSAEAMEKAEEIAKKTTYFELSVDSKYMDEYMAALFLPHTDLSRFPTVKV
ncbi:MAG: ASKHA domain-containing protein [Candidatus Omnitrophota bacterium]|nr:ASKHA domain-containing protein [Candidatus Omnitrophota bacterium]